MDGSNAERSTEINNVLKETELKIKEGKVESMPFEEFVKKQREFLNDLIAGKNNGK